MLRPIVATQPRPNNRPRRVVDDSNRQTLRALPNYNFNYENQPPRRHNQEDVNPPADLINRRVAILYALTMALTGMEMGYRMADIYLPPVPGAVISILSATSVLTTTLVGTTLGAASICCLGPIGPVIGFCAGFGTGQILNYGVPFIGDRLHNLLLAAAFFLLFNYMSGFLVRTLNAMPPVVSAVLNSRKEPRELPLPRLISLRVQRDFVLVMDAVGAMVGYGLAKRYCPVVPDEAIFLLNSTSIFLSPLLGSLISEAGINTLGKASLFAALASTYFIKQVLDLCLPFIGSHMYNILLACAFFLLFKNTSLLLVDSINMNAPAIRAAFAPRPQIALPAVPVLPSPVPVIAPPAIAPPAVIESPVAPVSVAVAATTPVSEIKTPGELVSSSNVEQASSSASASVPPVEKAPLTVAELRSRYLAANGSSISAAGIFGMFKLKPHAEVMATLRAHAEKNPNGASAAALGLNQNR